MAGIQSGESRKRPFLIRALRLFLILGVVGFISVFALVRGSAYYFASQPADAVQEDMADVIIVLSAGLTRDALELDPFTKARVARAVELWRARAAPTILMSGGKDLNTGLFLSETMKREAMALGARERYVLTEGASVSTFENARFTLEHARNEGWRKAIVVTDDFHLLRAWTLFEYWREPNDLEIVALQAADGRQAAGLGPSVLLLLRETFAVPFNVAKMVAHTTLEFLGLSEEIVIR